MAKKSKSPKAIPIKLTTPNKTKGETFGQVPKMRNPPPPPPKKK